MWFYLHNAQAQAINAKGQLEFLYTIFFFKRKAEPEQKTTPFNTLIPISYVSLFSAHISVTSKMYQWDELNWRCPRKIEYLQRGCNNE